LNEADTCRKYVTPLLQAAGWDKDPHRLNEQVTFTDGRIVVAGHRARRRPGKRADYVLRYRPDMPIAVVEAKPDTVPAGDGLLVAVNLDLKNPRAKNDIVHRPPEELVAGILEKEQRIIEIMGRIRELLEKPL